MSPLVIVVMDVNSAAPSGGEFEIRGRKGKHLVLPNFSMKEINFREILSNLERFLFSLINLIEMYPGIHGLYLPKFVFL